MKELLYLNMRDKNPQIYLAPITPRMEMRDIEERFIRYGPIRDIQIKRGYGFIVSEESELVGI